MNRNLVFRAVKGGFAAILLILVSFGGASAASFFSLGINKPNIEDIFEGGRSGTISQLAKHRSDEIIVKFKGEEKFKKIKLSESDTVEETLRRYRSRKDVIYAEPNFIAEVFFVPNDPYYRYQWHLDNGTSGSIHSQAAWDISNGSGITVAIIDTGIAYETYSIYKKAPDLAGTLLAPGYDFVNNDTHPNDDNAHGTHVAGTVAQTTNNGTGVAGVAYGATLMPIKVLDRNGFGNYADIADGIRFAADNGAKVINMSLGGPVPVAYLEEALGYAYSKGVTIVAATGNDNNSTVSYPAAYDSYVIAVGATRFDENRAPYSNYGSSLDLMAPGGDLSVDQNGDGYGDGVLQQTFRKGFPSSFAYYFYDGTSMASPHVAGVVAMLLSSGKASSPGEVRDILQSTAKDLATPGWDNTTGWGLLNAEAALKYNPGPVDNLPSVTLTNPVEGSVVSGAVTLQVTASDDFGVSRVDFYVDSSLVGSDSTAPYEFLWDSSTVVDGNHVIKATAVDSVSQSSSDSAPVIVDNINDSPMANAGADQTVTDSNGDGFETVTLNASGSFDPDGSIVSYEWRESTSVLGNTVSISPLLAVGSHTITLKVTDNDGASSQDSVVVTVNPQGPQKQTLLFDDFENGFASWVESGEFDWTVQMPAERTVPGSAFGNRVAHADACTSSSGCFLTLTNSLSLSGYSSATLSFWRFVDDSLDPNEFLKVEVFNGSSWQTLFFWTHGAGDDNTWRKETVDLAPYKSANFKIRFISKESSMFEEVEIDDVLIEVE